MSDEPAMHDEKLNARSFAKRGLFPLQSFASVSLLISLHSIPEQGQTPIHVR